MCYDIKKKMHTLMDIILCKFAVVWSLSSHSRIFHSYGDVTITGEGLQILTYARHSWPLSSGGSIASRTYCDKGIRLNWSSPRTRDTHSYCRAFTSGAVITCFYYLGPSLLGFEHRAFLLQSSYIAIIKYLTRDIHVFWR